MTTVSLIICTYQRPQETQRLLETLVNQKAIPDEIIVVDGSLDNETELVINNIGGIFGSRLKYLHVGEEERGLTRQRNKGIRHTKGEIIAFLDDDTLPDQNYFAEVCACFQRHPEAIGVGGLITNGTKWQIANVEKPSSVKTFRWGKWECRESFRWRLRKFMGLDSSLPPGWMPHYGHGRSSSYPPDGNDYEVEFVMGCASAWRRCIFDIEQFSRYFEGYGLYEDLDFCIRAARIGSIYLCTRAQLEHHHASGGRPKPFKYGRMVVRNGWYVWRRRWPNPSMMDKLKWWEITLILACLRLIDFRNSGPQEAAGRLWGMLMLLFRKPDGKG